MTLSDIMGHMRLDAYPQAALVLFLTAFVAIVVRTLQASRADSHEVQSRLPLREDENSPTRCAGSSKGE